MSDRSVNTAEAALERLLLALPLAAREGGVRIDALARTLAVEPRQILRDMEEVQGRSYYLPAGIGDQIQLLTLTHEELRVWTTGAFRRPTRLTPREVAALAFGLRLIASPERGTPAEEGAPTKAAWATRPTGAGPDGTGEEGSSDPGSAREELRRRLESALGNSLAAEARRPDALSAPEVERSADAIRSEVERALDGGWGLEIDYRAPGREPARRRAGPVRLVHAEGRWYLLAHDFDREDGRAFRMDRILHVRVTDTPFVPTPEHQARADAFLGDGRVHDGGGPHAPEPFEATVLYAPTIASWIREKGWASAKPTEDGGLRVRHEVFETGWIVGHVLGYAGEARVEAPDWLAREVAAAARRVAEACAPGREASLPTRRG